jgi:hypothetical protein
MLLLFETPAGYSLFKVKDEDKLKDIDVRVPSVSFLLSFVGFFFSFRVKEKGIARTSLICVSSRRQFSRGQLTRNSLGERLRRLCLFLNALSKKRARTNDATRLDRGFSLR